MDIATLGISVDSSDAQTAAADLDKLTAAGARAEQSAKGTGTAFDQSGKKIAAASNSIGQAAAKTGSSFTQADQQIKAATNSIKQTEQALRQLPMQMTDITVGLTTGQSPFYVLMQQGGQLKDSFGGIGPAARAVGGYVAALVNPFTIAAAAVGLLAMAYKQGSDEQTAFGKAIASTGNYAGVSTRQLAGMANQIDAQVGTTRDAAAALTMLVSTGAIYGDQLQELAQAAVAWERATGTAVDDTVKQFAQLAKDPVAASEKLNETYHYLTLAVYEQIRALQEQGRIQDAAVIAERAYAAALSDRSRDIQAELGYIESAWSKVKSGAAEAWDAMLGVGRESTIDQQLSRLYLLREFAANPRARANLDSQIADINLQKVIEEGNARMWAEDAKVQQRGIDAENKIASIRDASLTNAERRQKAIADYLRNIEDVRTANPASALLDQSKIDRDIQNIKDKYKDENKPNLDNISSFTFEAFDEVSRKAKESSSVMHDVAQANENYFASIAKTVDKAQDNVASISDFLMTDEERLKDSYERRQGMLDEAHDYGIVSEEKYLELKLKLQEKYEADSKKLQSAATAYILGNAAQIADGLAGIAEVTAGKQSGLYKLLFATSKAFSIAQAIVNTEEAATKALTLGPILGIPASNVVRGLGYASVGIIAGQTIAGIAHDGMDNIPREGTWLLNGGERVVAPQQNKDLTKFLQGGGSGVNVTIIEDASRAGTVEQSGNDVRAYVSQFRAQMANDIRRGGGPLTKAMEEVYGLSRAMGARR